MTVRRRAEADLRFDIPRLEPDDAFVERLAVMARSSQPSAATRRPLQGLRVGLATAGLVGVTVGGAWAAGNLVEREDRAPGRSPATESSRPISPEPSPTTKSGPVAPNEGGRGPEGGPGRAPDNHGSDQGRPDRPGEQGQDHGRHRGRPDEHPGGGHGREHDRGRPPGLPAPGDGGQGNGAENRNESADPGGPKGSGGGRRADSPR